MTALYRSYDYLVAGVDYQSFELARELGRVPSSAVQLDAEQRVRVDDLVHRATLVSLHDHPTVRPLGPYNFREYRRQGREVTGFEGLRVAALDVVVDGMMAGAAFMTSGSGWKWTDVTFDLGMRQCDLAHQDDVRVVRRASEVPALKTSGRTGLVFAIESAAPIENELDRLDVLFGLGVRIIGLTYGASNALGSGLGDPSDAGLTNFGRAAVRRMNQIGLLIDLSHTADRTSLETIDASEQPVVISHTGARSLWDIPRLKSDDVLRACAEHGGVVGITAAPHTTITRSRPRHCLDSVMEHFEYCAELVGIGHVGFGPDVNFGDHVAWHREFAGGALKLPPGTEPVEYVDGIENPAEAFINIVSWLVVHGYTDDEITKVIGGNALRLFGEVWPEPAE
jgi:membrane dipeptidase